MKKNYEGKISCRDLLEFLNLRINPVTPIPPVSIKASLWYTPDKEQATTIPGINWQKFLEDLNIKTEDPASAITDQ